MLRFHLFYPHTPISVTVFVCLFVFMCVCTVTDFSAEDKAASNSARGSSASWTRNLRFWRTLLPQKLPQKPKIGRIGCVARAGQPWLRRRGRVHGPRVGSAYEDKTGYTAVPEDGYTCFLLICVDTLN